MTIEDDNFDYGRLLGRIKEKGFNNSSIADAMGVGRSTLYTKLNNQSEFTQAEIKRLSTLLEIEPGDLATYFFTQKVRKTVQN